MQRHTRVFLAAVSTVAFVQGCSSAPHPHAAQETALPVIPRVSTSVTSLPVPATEGRSSGQSYAVQSIEIDGATTDKVGTWTAQAAQLRRGDQRVADAFNAASRNSVTDLIKAAQNQATAASWTFKANSAVSFLPLSISQLTTGVYAGQGAAHPINFVATVVIDSRNAKPITLNDLFVNEQDGLVRLSEYVKRVRQVDDPSGGSTPTEENFNNWIPTDKGMELHFRDYQFGHGLPVLTVPWAELNDLLSPDMRSLASN